MVRLNPHPYSGRRPPRTAQGRAVATSFRRLVRASSAPGLRLMAREGARPSYDPAGPDHALRAVLQEVRTGRWVAMRTLLAETTEWWLWTQRTQILAAAAAGSAVVRAWLGAVPGRAHAGGAGVTGPPRTAPAGP